MQGKLPAEGHAGGAGRQPADAHDDQRRIHDGRGRQGGDGDPGLPVRAGGVGGGAAGAVPAVLVARRRRRCP